MDRREAAREIRENDCSMWCKEKTPSCKDCRWGVALEALGEPEWISCSERLPENKVDPETGGFLEYEVTLVIDGKRSLQHCYFRQGLWWRGPEVMNKYVVAWRERPEPWEG